MQIRPIHSDETAAFAAVRGPADRAAAVGQHLEQMFARGAMPPDWCFLAEDAGQVLGHVAYWTLPPSDMPRDLVLLDPPWEGAWRPAGRALLRWPLADLRARGAARVGHVLDTPPRWPQWQDHPARRRPLLEHAGFAVERATRRFAWRADGDSPAATRRLAYRALEEVGERAFLAALARVSADTLDRRDRQERERDGPEGAARNTFAALRQLAYEPGWWQLAYTPAGTLAGLIMPARNPGAATIGYIGVVPELRGRGMATLRAAGATAIVADTDVANTPMAKAFRRTGWVQFATRGEYSLDLATRSPAS